MNDRLTIRALIIALALGTGSSSHAQIQYAPGTHEARLSGWCQIVGAQQKTSGNLGDFIVRKGGHLVVTGVRQSVFVEDGGSVEMNGLASTVYVTKGGKAVVSGERNQIYAEPGSNIMLQGLAAWSQVTALTLQLHRNAVNCQ